MLKHVAIIMDGNGRWANARHLPRLAGHKKGASSAKAAIEAAVENNIDYLTLYAFSNENWSRPEDEVRGLMDLLKYYLSKELSSIHKNGVKLKIMGDLERLNDDIRQQIDDAEALTANNTQLHLNVALSYGSRQEIVRATKQIAQQIENGELNADSVDESTINKALYTSNIPDPDLLIRTGGEQRISNFLLWQCAYTEFYFTDILWPDFDKKAFKAAVDEYHTRERRFGNAKDNAPTQKTGS